MDLKIDFDHPDILKGYLEQALPQCGLEDKAGRIVVGLNGGLAYRLFGGSEQGNVPERPKMSTVDEINLIRNYFDALENYVQPAKGHAEEFNFGLISVAIDGEIDSTLGVDYNPFRAGIGDVSIGSVEKFEKFLQMLKSPNMEDLKMLYCRVQDAIGALHEKE